MSLTKTDGDGCGEGHRGITADDPTRARGMDEDRRRDSVSLVTTSAVGTSLTMHRRTHRRQTSVEARGQRTKDAGRPRTTLDDRRRTPPDAGQHQKTAEDGRSSSAACHRRTSSSQDDGRVTRRQPRDGDGRGQGIMLARGWMERNTRDGCVSSGMTTVTYVQV